MAPRRPGAAGQRPAARIPLPDGVLSWQYRERCGRCRAGEAPAAGSSFPLPGEVPELDFAPVRPGFVAACMVEAASTRGGCRIRVGRPERPPPHCWTVGRDGRRSRVDPTRQAGERRVAALGTHTAVPYSQKQTNGTFDPGCGKPSRRCSARCGYHCARASRRRGPGIDYLE